MSTYRISTMQAALLTVYAFAFGAAVAVSMFTRGADAAIQHQRSRADLAERRLLQLDLACTPLLSLPPESTPELIDVSPMAAQQLRDARGARHAQ